MKVNLKVFFESIDESEQYSCRNSLLLHGTEEEWKEDTDDVVIKSLSENLDKELNKKDLYRTHHVVKLNHRDGKPHPILIKFALS